MDCCGNLRRPDPRPLFQSFGRGEKTRYYTSFSYIDEGGTTINTNAKMFFTRINFDYFLSCKLLFSVQFNYNSNSTEGNMSISGRNIRQMAYIKAPNMSIWEYDQFGKLTGEYFTPINSYQGYGGDYYNPVAVSELGKRLCGKHASKHVYFAIQNLRLAHLQRDGLVSIFRQ